MEGGEISVETINKAVKRVLKLKFQLGLFDDPYRYSDTKRESETIMHPDFVQTATQMARESIVLLKNDDDLLPLQPGMKVAVIGPLAKDKDSPIGNWRAQGKANSAVSLFEGLQNTLGEGVNLEYAEGVKLSLGPNTFHQNLKIEENDRSGFSKAIAAAKSDVVVIMALGETAYMSGEGRSRSDIGLPGLQLELLKEIYKVNKKVVLVLMNGRPLALPWEEENIPAIIEAWHLGTGSW